MATWAEVEEKPEYQKLTPEEKEAARGQYFDQVIAPKVPKEQLQTVRAQFDRDTTPGLASRSAITGGVELLAKGITGAVAAIPAGITYGGAAIGKALGADVEPRKVAGRVQQALTYEPVSIAGQQGQQALASLAKPVIDPVKRAYGEAATAVGKVSPVAETMMREAPFAAQAAAGVTPVAGMARGIMAAGKAGAAPAVAGGAAKLAEDYIASNTALKWDELPAAFKSRLQQIAKDPEALARLDPKAVERQGRLEALGMPATRGQVTRNLAELTKEENLSKSEEGAPIRDINAAQDARLHELVDTLRKDTGAQASTRQGVGKSVQDTALRAKAAESKANYDRLYVTARATEPNAMTSPAPLYEYLEKNPEVQHLGFMDSWLKKAKIKSVGEPEDKLVLETSVKDALKKKGKPKEEEMQIRDVTLAELDDLRKKASGIARKGGDNAYYAGQIVGVIDKAFEQIPQGAKAWRAARDAYKAHKREFEEQGAVKKLVGEKSRTDRKTALEDTFDTFLRGSAEDINKVRTSLLTGGTEKTRAAGTQAWKDLQGATLDYLKDKARGKREIAGEKGQPQFNSAFQDAFLELDKDGKIDAIFSPEQAKMLREISQAVGDLRTKPTGRIAGSDTASRLVSKLEKVSMVPWGGKYVAGAAKLAGKVGELGKTTRDVARAKTTPIDDELKAATGKRNTAKSEKKLQRRKNVLKSLKRTTAATPFTLKRDHDANRDSDRNPP